MLALTLLRLVVVEGNLGGLSLVQQQWEWGGGVLQQNFHGISFMNSQPCSCLDMHLWGVWVSSDDHRKAQGCCVFALTLLGLVVVEGDLGGLSLAQQQQQQWRSAPEQVTLTVAATYIYPFLEPDTAEGRKNKKPYARS